jgi:secreted trypsin-like serine protease
MTALSRNDCKQHWYDQGDYFICAYSGTSSACHGDSGGSFILQSWNGYYVVAGVASMVHIVNGDCAVSSASGYVRVSMHLDWIHSLIDQM